VHAPCACAWGGGAVSHTFHVAVHCDTAKTVNWRRWKSANGNTKKGFCIDQHNLHVLALRMRAGLRCGTRRCLPPRTTRKCFSPENRLNEERRRERIRGRGRGRDETVRGDRRAVGTCLQNFPLLGGKDFFRFRRSLRGRHVRSVAAAMGFEDATQILTRQTK
jgi:hypothetical protein